MRWQRINVRLLNEQTENQLNLLNNLPMETQNWDITLGMRNEIMDIKVLLLYFFF